MTFVSIAGMDHYAAIWWPQVETAISKFLKISPMKLDRPSADGVAFPQLPAGDLESYAKARPHRAIAANKSGSWASTTGAGSKLDAEEEAMFTCDGKAEADAFLDASHMHNCVPVDVNGERLVK